MQRAESFVPYTIQVYASTAAGRGRAVSTMIFTGHGGGNNYYNTTDLTMVQQ